MPNSSTVMRISMFGGLLSRNLSIGQPELGIWLVPAWALGDICSRLVRPARGLKPGEHPVAPNRPN